MKNRRREFLKNSAGSAALAGTRPWGGISATTPAEPMPVGKTIGIQVGVVLFVEQGMERVLDSLQERRAIDTICFTAFTYGRGLAGRQIPGPPFPDHCAQESADQTFHGGNYAPPHPEFYLDPVMKQTQSSDHGDLDSVVTVLPRPRSAACK